MNSAGIEMTRFRVSVGFLCLVLSSVACWGDEGYQAFMKKRLWDDETQIEQIRHSIERLDLTGFPVDLSTLHDEVKTDTFADEIRNTVESVSDAVSDLPSESLLSTDNRTTVKQLVHLARQYRSNYGRIAFDLPFARDRYQAAADRQAELDTANGDDSDETPMDHICERLSDDPDYLVAVRCDSGNQATERAKAALERIRAYKTSIDGFLDDLVTPEIEE